MHARLSFIEGTPDSVEGGVKSFRDEVVPFVRDNGGEGVYLLIDRQAGKAIGITLWESEDALRASAERAAVLRDQAAEEMHAPAGPKFEQYEVVVAESF